MITRVGQIAAAEGKGDALFTFLQSLTSYISGSDGCLGYEVLRNRDAPEQFVVIERWESAEAHQSSLSNYPKEAMQEAMTLVGGQPTAAYYHSE